MPHRPRTRLSSPRGQAAGQGGEVDVETFRFRRRPGDPHVVRSSRRPGRGWPGLHALETAPLEEGASRAGTGSFEGQ